MERKARVLGVDDSLTIRKALEIVLKPAGYELELAVDGADALAKAKTFKPDVILLDFILPDMRGSEVCQHLALDPDTAHIPVILVSAKGAEIRQAYRDATNVVSYIAKPFKPQVVTSIVADVLAKTAAGEQVKAVVPVHEAEGLSIPPMPTPPVTPPPSPAAGAPLTAAPPPQPSPPPAQTMLPTPAPPLPVSTVLSGAGAPTLAEKKPPARPRRPVAPIEAPADAIHPAFATEAERREALDLIFETLRSSIEGVYVEEVDTPLGAAADQAKSYIQILEALIQELSEGVRHARSGAKFLMYSDGSVRSLDGALYEIFRRTARLLFRATSAGVVTSETPAQKQRVLVLCAKGSTVSRQIPALVAAHPHWQAFNVNEGFRQVPMVVRLFGPSLVIAEVTGSGALWEQLRLVAQLPELQGAEVVGVVSADRALPPWWGDASLREQALAERKISRLIASIFELEQQPREEPQPGAPSGNGAAQESAPPDVIETSTSREHPTEFTN